MQSELLDRAALRVRPDGILVYSTCSLEPEENGEQVRRFLLRHPQFRLETEEQLTPQTHQLDGAYVARLRLAR